MIVNDFDGVTVLVTGAGRGQGAETARLFAARGAMVWVTDRDVEMAAEVADAIGPRAVPRRLNVADPDSWDELVAELTELGVLVNNAAVYRRLGVAEQHIDDLEAIAAVNQIGPQLGVRACLTLLTASRGNVVNISSTAALGGAPRASAYTSTKWAIRGITRSLARELAPLGIRVNCVVPGLIDTGMAAINGPELNAEYVAAIPLGRMGSTREVAVATAFLASAEASYITGAEVVVDGGATA